MIAFYAACIAAGAWIGTNAAGVHYTVQQDGSWYNDLKIEDRCTYWNRLKYTLRNRVYVGRWIAFMLGGSVGLWAVTYVLVTGLLAILTRNGWLL